MDKNLQGDEPALTILGKKFYYPQSGEPATVHFDVRGERPTQEEAVRLTNIPNKKKPVGGEESRGAILYFVVSCVAAVAAWFFGRWVLGNFGGVGKIVWGYGASYVAAPIFLIYGIISLHKLFRSAQKTAPKAALEWIYLVSYLGDDAVMEGKRFGAIDYSLATIERIVPDSPEFDREAIRRHVTSFRDTLIRGMEITAAEARKDPPGDWKESWPLKAMQLDGTEELFPGVMEMRATITYKDVLARTDDAKATGLIAAILELHIVHVMVRSGKYWYPYDLLPPILCRQELPALQST